jgi:hypothetical protein
MNRIIDESVLQKEHQDLIGRILPAIDLQALREALQGMQIKLDPIQDIQPTGGALIPLHDRLALRLDLKVTVPLTITVDAEGNFLPVLPVPAQPEEIAGEAASAAQGCSESQFMSENPSS